MTKIKNENYWKKLLLDAIKNKDEFGYQLIKTQLELAGYKVVIKE